MKKTILTTVLAGAAVFALSLGLTACTGNSEYDYDYLVTFDYNVGTLSEKEIADQYLGVKENSLVVTYPGDDRGYFTLGAISNYYMDGWFTAKTDEDGAPVTGEDGRVVLDREWDFSSDRVTSDITLYANFVEMSHLTVLVDGEAYNTYDYAPGSTLLRPSRDPVKTDWTFYGYYEDEACTQPFEWPYVFTAEEQQKTVYTKFIEGSWTIVVDEESFQSALTLKKDIYLDADLDFTDMQWTSPAYTGTLNGNGHTVSGISLSFVGDRSHTAGFAIFSSLGEDAHIYDVEFSADIEFTARINNALGEYNVAFFAWYITEGAKVENVKASGTLRIAQKSETVTSLINAYAVCTNGVETDESCDFSEIVIIDENEVTE